MSTLIPPGYGQLVIRYLLTGDPDEMIITMGVNLGAAGGDFQAAVDNGRAQWATAFPASSVQNAYTYMGARLYVGQDGAASTVFESNVSIVGTKAGSVLPQNCAALFKKLTGFAGRHYRGRCFLPPITFTEGDVDGTGLVTESVRAALQTRVDNFRTGLNLSAPSIPMVLLHGPGSGIAPTVVTSTPVESKIATMRRRLRK